MLGKVFFESLSNKKIAGFIFIYVFFLLLLCSHMSPLYFSNEWSDVNIYFNIGKAIFNGQTLYTEIFDHKGPLIFFIYGFGYLISNNSFFGMFLIELAGWFAMVYFMYKTANLYLGKAGACFVAMILPVLLIKIMKAGGSVEEFILCFEAVSFYYFVRYFKNEDNSIHDPKIMLVHGILSSAVFFMKLNLMLIWFFPIAGICINLMYRKEFKNLILNLLGYILGFLLVAVPVFMYFYVNGAVEEAYNVYIELNSRYAQLQGAGDTLILLMYRSLFLYLEPLSMCVLLFIGVFYFPIKYLKSNIGKCVILLSGITTIVMIYISPVYQYYYPIPLLMFSGLGVLSIFLFAKKYVQVDNLPFKFVFVFAFILVYAGMSQTDLSAMRMAGLLVKNPGLLMQGSRNIIVQEKNPTLLNLSFGLGNSLFTTCNIVPNVKYFISPNLTYESYPEMRDEQEQYIKNKEVQFIIITKPSLEKHNSSISAERKTSNYDFFTNLPALKENYTLVKEDTVINTIDERKVDIYELYKRID